MDAIVTLCRALANDLRLCLLREVCQHPGITVEALAERVGVAPYVVSSHLRVLVELRLLDSRPSGRFVHVHPPAVAGANTTLGDEVARLLLCLFATEQDANSTPAQVWNSRSGNEEEEGRAGEGALDRLGWYFTAYTHLRRLLLLRHLATHGATGQERLCEEIGMSPPAASRHLSKLERRGLVRRTPVDGVVQWELVATPADALQARLHEAVMRALTPPAA